MIDEQKHPETPVEPSVEIADPSGDVESELQQQQSNPERSSQAEGQMSEGSETLEPTDQVNLSQIIEVLQLENEALKKDVEERDRQLETYKGQLVRTAADFDNFRKRTLKEKEDLEQRVKRDTIMELLPVVDNFERARSHIKPANDGEMAIHKSYQGVYKDFVNSLKRIGVSAMRPEGQPFDPNYHEAMMQVQTDEYPEDAVIEQLVRGYLLGEKVLRHAMVKVAAPKDPVVTSEEESLAEESSLDS